MTDIRLYLPFYILLLLIVVACTSDDTATQPKERSERELASIGEYSISETHYKNMFERFQQRVGRMQQVNHQVLTSILDDEVDLYTAVTLAKDQGWADDTESRYRKDVIRRQVLMEEYERRYVHPQVQVTEDFLEVLFARLNTYLRASHIYAPDRYAADSLYQAIMNGADFGQVAAKTFNDPSLAESGGDVGYFTVDDMDVGFEYAAYDMEVGEISEPVRTSRGYSIIKLTDRVTHPLLTEQEFANKKPRLRSMANEQLGELERREDMYRKIDEMNPDRRVLKEIWNEVKDEIRGGIQAERVESNPFQAIPRDLREKNIVDSDVHQLSVDEFTDEAFFADAQALERLDNFNQFEKFAEGIAFRTYALEKILNSDRMHREYVDAAIDRTFHVYLNRRLNDIIGDTIEVDEGEVRQEFERNRRDFYHPVELNLAELAIDDPEKAEKVYDKITGGEIDFVTALHEYGFDEEAKVYDGELGYIPINKFGGISPALQNAEPGDVLGPFEMQEDVIFIFKTLGRRDAERMSFEEARDQIKRTLKQEKVQRERNRILRNARSEHDAKVHYSKLREIRLTQ